jgi:hypothetical protein
MINMRLLALPYSEQVSQTDNSFAWKVSLLSRACLIFSEIQKTDGRDTFGIFQRLGFTQGLII